MAGKGKESIEAAIVTLDQVEKRIYEIRGHKVMLDRELATLYGVETRVLKQAVRRHLARFPDDFMFVLSTSEFTDWRS